MKAWQRDAESYKSFQARGASRSISVFCPAHGLKWSQALSLFQGPSPQARGPAWHRRKLCAHFISPGNPFSLWFQSSWILGTHLLVSACASPMHIWMSPRSYKCHPIHTVVQPMTKEICVLSPSEVTCASAWRFILSYKIHRIEKYK